MRTRITFFVIAILTLNFFISSNTILYGQVPNDGLVAWWTFEEGTGTITYDKSGNGHNGTLNGASWVSGGVEFLLNTQYVKFEDTPFRLAEGTWQVLINVKDFNMAWGYGSIVEKDYTNWNNDGRLVVLNNGKIQFDIDDKSTSSTKSIVSTDPIPLNTDIEIVASWGQQGMKLYINKLLVGTNPHKGEITSSIGRPLTAGSNFVGTRSFIGIVKDLKVYNKYLLENVPGLMAYYPFNGNAYDMSGNGNNGNASEVTFAEEGTRKVAQFTTSSYVEVPDNSSLDFSSVAGVTFAVWIKQEQSSMGDIFRKMGNSGSSDDEYALGINATGQLSGAFNGPGQQM